MEFRENLRRLRLERFLSQAELARRAGLHALTITRLEAGLTIASILYGALLGVFLLGLLTRRVQENAAMTGMIAGWVTMICVKQFTHIAFTWYVMIGTFVTFTVGYVMSMLFREPPSVPISVRNTQHA